MKKIWFFIITVVLLGALKIPTYASVNNINELGLTVNISKEYCVLTRNGTEDVDGFNSLGIDIDDAIQNMKSSNIYLDAVNNEDFSEIIITGQFNLINDFSLFSDDDLQAASEYLIPAMKENGAKDIKVEIKNFDNENFIILDYWHNNGDQKVYTQQYYTVYNNQAINIQLNSYGSIIKPITKADLLWTVKNIRYQSDHPPKHQESLYSDDTVSFTIPSGWEEGKLSKQREYYNALIDSSKQLGVIVLYGCTDIFDKYKMAVFQKRQNYNTEAISDEIIDSVIHEILKEDHKLQYEKITIGEQKYIKIKSANVSLDNEINTSEYPIDLSNIDNVSATHIFYINNGYIYLYSLVGIESEIYEQDLMKMVSSAIYKYPKPNDLNETLISFFDNAPVYIVTSLILAFLLSCLPIVIYRYKIKRKPVSFKEALLVMVVFTIIKALIMVAISLIFNIDLISSKGTVVPIAWYIIDLLILSKGYKKTESNYKMMESPSDKKEKIDLNNLNKGNINKILYCRNCGVKLNELSAFCKRCGFYTASQTEVQDYCRKCGRKLPVDSRYCQYCGKKILYIKQEQE